MCSPSLFISDTTSTSHESDTSAQINKAIISEMVFIDCHGLVSCLHGFLMYILNECPLFLITILFSAWSTPKPLLCIITD